VAEELERLEPVLDGDQLVALQERTKKVKVAEKLVDYMLDLAEASRQRSEFLLPVSTRGAENLYRATQALAFCEGRAYAVPDDVQRLVEPVLGHRVVLRRGDGGLDETREAMRRVLASTPVPL
jgi:MoxR-like ATPase